MTLSDRDPNSAWEKERSDTITESVNTILSASQTAGVVLPLKLKSEWVMTAAITEITRGKTRPEKMLILNLTLPYRRVTDIMKLKPSMMIITRA